MGGISYEKKEQRLRREAAQETAVMMGTTITRVPSKKNPEKDDLSEKKRKSHITLSPIKDGESREKT